MQPKNIAFHGEIGLKPLNSAIMSEFTPAKSPFISTIKIFIEISLFMC